MTQSKENPGSLQEDIEASLPKVPKGWVSAQELFSIKYEDPRYGCRYDKSNWLAKEIKGRGSLEGNLDSH